MPQDVSQDIASLREWLAKESHLPTDFNELMLRKFLHSCYGSLEKSKKCIDRFCSTRSAMPEVYTARDPRLKQLQLAFSITCVVSYNIHDDMELLIHQLDDPTLAHFNYYDVLKTFTIQGDCWLKDHPVLPSGHVIVLDMKCITMKIIPRCNILFFKDFLMFLLEGMPVRVKQVYAVNCPSYYERMYALVKPVLPAEIVNIISFHTTGEALQKFIDKKYLPVDYGGDAESMKTQQLSWLKRIDADREFYLNDNMWKADLNKKPKSQSVETAMTGSFRTLSID